MGLCTGGADIEGGGPWLGGPRIGGPCPGGLCIDGGP